MVTKKDVTRLTNLLIVAIFITLFLIVNSEQFRISGIVFFLMELFALVALKLKLI